MRVERNVSGAITSIEGMGRKAAVMRELHGDRCETALVEWFLDCPKFQNLRWLGALVMTGYG